MVGRFLLSILCSWFTRSDFVSKNARSTVTKLIFFIKCTVIVSVPYQVGFLFSWLIWYHKTIICFLTQLWVAVSRHCIRLESRRSFACMLYLCKWDCIKVFFSSFYLFPQNGFMFLGDGRHGWRSTSSNYHLDGLGKQCDNSCRYAQGHVRDGVIGYFELF